MASRTAVSVLCSLFVLFSAAPLLAQQPPISSGGANIFSPKLCFTVQIPGNWKPSDYPGSYVSPDGKQYVSVTPMDAKDLTSFKGATLLEKESAALVKIHEKSLQQKLKGVSLVPFASAVQGTWKWTAAPIKINKLQMVFMPRYLADLSPEGIIVIDIENTPDDDALARSILSTLNISRTQPCQLPQSTKELVKGILDTHSAAKPATPPPNDTNIPLRTFKNPAMPWSMRFPETWQIDAADPRQMTITRPGPGDDTGCQIFSVSVQFKNVDEFADFWLRQTAEHTASQGGHLRRTDRQRMTLPNGVEAIDVRSENSPGGRSRMTFALVDGTGYLMECRTSVNYWESMAPVFAKIAESFTIEKKP